MTNDHHLAPPRPASDQHGLEPLISLLRHEIEKHGAITFARFMEIAQFHPEFGYYMSPRRAPGRGGDFITSPEVHPFFGITIANQIAEFWNRLERPNPFVIREEGAGIGGLAYDIIAGLSVHHPEVRSALQYRLSDINPFRLEQAVNGMTEAGLDDVLSIENSQMNSTIEPITGVVLANEVADALPVHNLIWTGQELNELWVDWNPSTDWFSWKQEPLSREVEASDPQTWLRGCGVNPESWPAGATIAWSPALRDWTLGIGARLDRGYAIIIDYGYPANELYRDHRLAGTIRCYREHTVSDNPFIHIGEQDITAHVDFSLVASIAADAGMDATPTVTQGHFLSRLGLGQHLVDLQQSPETDAAAYYRAQASVLRLIDPGGLGRFRVLGLGKNAPMRPLPTGFTDDDLPAALRFP